MPPRRRTPHDAIRSAVATTSRSEIGAVTSYGRLLRFTPVDLPSVPTSSIQLGAGISISDYIGFTPATRGERIVGLVSLAGDVPIALGTARGIVKRVAPSGYPARPEFEIISLKPGDQVVSAGHAADDDQLVFVTSDAQLLRFGAALVRPQGPSAGGMAGITVSAGASVIAFSVVAARELADVVVATVSMSSQAITGIDPGRAKVSPLSEFSPKGRATSGVRAHSFLKGEDVLQMAWAGSGPPVAVASDGAPRALPQPGAKRDASGAPLDQVIGSIGSSI